MNDEEAAARGHIAGPHVTPWGIPQTVDFIAEGVVEVSTCCHGGIILSQERYGEMPWPFRAFQSLEGWQYWEESENAAVVVAAFSELFPPQRVDQACRTIRRWAEWDEEFEPLLDYLPATRQT